MHRTSTVRIAELRRTSVRGLEPTRLMLIVASVVLCGFAFGFGLDGSEDANVTPQAEEGRRVPIHELSPGAQREMLLSDEDALHRATVWLARAIYSESHRRQEQYLVAWVVRNRVETRYRGETTYRDVVTDPYQFSAFNPGSGGREFYLTIDSTHVDRTWQQAMAVATSVILAEADERPFPITTRHFYSERSLQGADIPEWALETEPVDIAPFSVDERRFRFFDGVS